MEPVEPECFICRKHRGEFSLPGGAIYEDELLFAGHALIPDSETITYLGALLLEPKRHVAGLGDLNSEEAQRVGLLLSRLSRALKESLGAEHIYLFVLGHHVAHLHLWLIPRYPGTPRQYWGVRVEEWPEAPKGGPQEIADLCDRVRSYLSEESTE